MSMWRPIRLQDASGFARLAAIALLLAAGGAAPGSAQEPDQKPAQRAGPVVLDRVVAVVNNQAILASDIDDEIRLSVLDPGRGGLGVLTRINALDQLIGRALIQQQIRQEDLESSAPAQSEVDARLEEIRKELPACVRQNCASDAGWKAFLAAHGLTQEHVETYLRYRLEILRFIEQRFRQGISILPQEIQTYYRDTLLPQYAKGEAIPPLEAVAARIEEILLQQRVNALFGDWLNNLRKQGEVEVLDPTLEAPVVAAPPALAKDTSGNKMQEEPAAGAKAHGNSAPVPARLKSCPDTVLLGASAGGLMRSSADGSFSAECKAAATPASPKDAPFAVPGGSEKGSQ
jgi:peptidyl-prolyl cis-trans isomerase SurA